MKTTMKIFLVMALFCTTALADGDMGSGGYTCTTDPVTGQQTCVPNGGGGGGGGLSAPIISSDIDTKRDSGQTTQVDDTILDLIVDYVSLFF